MIKRLTAHRNLVLLAGIVVLSVLAVAAGSALPFGRGRTATRAFTVSARRFGFGPERLRVQQGDSVIIHLQSKDVTHGFYLDGYGIRTQASPGSDGTLQFVANQPGAFRFRCSTTCGPLHPFMIGQLNVESQTPYTNAPFLGAAAATLFVAVGAVSYSARKEGSGDGDAN